MAPETLQKVLIVDDESTNLQVIARAFEAMPDRPYEVLQTLSPVQALSIARTEQPDLIITDWDMPGVDGIELIRRLKADPATRDVLVIMCTGVMTTSRNLEAALDAGAVDYIRKPVDALELLARTRSMLHLAATLKRMRTQNEELEWMARTDLLTKLPNRRDFLEKLERQMASARRHGRTFVLAMADLDDFKAVNDRHGHAAGDAVLEGAASLLRQTVRTDDYVARWGGEEFILLFADTDLEGGRVIAEKIRQNVSERSWAFEGRALSVSVTIGACACDGRGELDALLRRADEALYEGKASGRNQVIVKA
ncbi:MAG: diguanylate cyclase [Acidobacteria bacterium]|nr:diguanylate cyclase [Acidobacteriota bacterium]